MYLLIGSHIDLKFDFIYDSCRRIFELQIIYIVFFPNNMFMKVIRNLLYLIITKIKFKYFNY